MAWLYRQKGSRFWWIGDRIDGQPLFKSTKKEDRDEAGKILATYNAMKEAKRAGKLTDELYQALSGKTLPTVTLKSALGDWLKECDGAASSSTCERYKNVGDGFLKHMRANDSGPLLRDVDTGDISSFLSGVRQHRSAATANLYRKILSSFFIRSVKQGILKSNPVWPIKTFKAKKTELANRRAYTLAELGCMYEKAPNDFWRYMILGGFYAGFRMGDLVLMKHGNIDLAANVIRLETGKTGKRMNVPMATPLRGLLLNLTGNGQKPSDPLWPDQSVLYEQQGAKAFSAEFYDLILTPCGMVPAREDKKKKKNGRGAKRAISAVSFHSLRHTFITFLKTTGSNQAVAKELAGHSSDAVNDLYTHVPEAALAEAIKQLPEVFK